jgi:hypothetical protein
VNPTEANLQLDTQNKERKTWLLYLETHIPIVQEEARENLLRTQIKQKELYNRNRRKAPKFQSGDLVLKKVNADIVPFATAKWQGPWTVIQPTNQEETAYELMRTERGFNRATTANISQLKEYRTTPCESG